MNTEKLKAQLITDEGKINYIYSDLDGKPTWPNRDKGNPTFGIGHKLINKDLEWQSWQQLKPNGKITVSNERIDEVFEQDKNICINNCQEVFDNFDKMIEELQIILANMMFNMGKTHFLGFKNFILAIKSANYLTAAFEMKDSDWYNQVPVRAERLRKRMMKLGLTKSISLTIPKK
jgi:Phage lysozyme